jgi:hypothetical protein
VKGEAPHTPGRRLLYAGIEGVEAGCYQAAAVKIRQSERQEGWQIGSSNPRSLAGFLRPSRGLAGNGFDDGA